MRNNKSFFFKIYFISYGCNGGALVFLGGAEASASPSFALPMFITIKKIIILHLILGVPAATLGGTGTPWHTRGYAPVLKTLISMFSGLIYKRCLRTKWAYHMRKQFSTHISRFIKINLP